MYKIRTMILRAMLFQISKRQTAMTAAPVTYNIKWRVDNAIPALPNTGTTTNTR